MSDPARTGATSPVEGVLLELARRGLLRPVAAAAAPAGLRGLAELGPRLAGAPFVTACGLRNLPVLNRLYGDSVGDLAMETLRLVATSLVAECDPLAEVGRSHGPDLLVLHGSPQPEQALALARRLRAALAAVVLPASGFFVHLHPFVATLEAAGRWRGSGDDLLRMLHELRELDEPGDGGVLLLSGAQADAALARLRTRDERLARVSEALERGEVEVHFQPVVNLRSGRLEDVEALARIRTPAGLLTASEFIDDLHRLRETAALDTLVMRRVGEGASLLAGATGRLFLNVSPLSLGSTAFREQMSATLARLRAEGLRVTLVLELTEQALLEHHQVIREIHRDHGVSFAVDDFGTGYSSLRTVSELAVSRVISILKIDGSLTRRISESPETYKVVLAIAHLARSLDLRVVAEHVENEETLALLRTTGVECGQGYLFDPPLAPEELLARHGGVGARYPEPSPRSQLSLLEPYLHRAFEGFYERLLSDPHFARFFADAAQIRSLVERQKRTLLESLDEDRSALAVRYARLGRIHAEIGIPLETFLSGADILHEELLDVLEHATREAQVLRDTVRFFKLLRELMARGYFERLLPQARAELVRLREWAAREVEAPPEVRGMLFGCMEGVLDRVEVSAAASLAARRGLPAGSGACPASAWLERAGVSSLHAQLHADAESLAYFRDREAYASAYPLLEGLIGRFERTLVALARRRPA